MIVLKANKTAIKSQYNGTPDRIIPRKEKVCKGSEIYFHPFDGWVDKPIYKDLSEINPSDLSKYNKRGYIYVYQPNHLDSDDMGIMTYKVTGATLKKSDKKVRLIVSNKQNSIYFMIEDDKVIDCGLVFLKTEEDYNKSNIGEEYTGYRRSKWIKLDPNDFSHLFGKVYSELKIY